MSRRALFVLLLTIAGCRPEAPDDPAGSARAFYAALAVGAYDEARSMVVANRALARLEHRFGSFEAWATRLTKNGILMRTEPLDHRIAGDEASVALLVLFDDGTRRHDRLDLVRTSGAWRIDAASVPGAS